MQKLLILVVLSQTLVYALYNPFFTELKPDRTVIIPQEKQKTIKYVKPEKRETIKMTYFGFIETKKGIFALVNFNGKDIVIRKNDSLYENNNILKVLKITSNMMVLKDSFGRRQSVYFSSEKEDFRR